MNDAPDERIAVTAALATLLSALTLGPLVQGRTWLVVATVVVVAVMVTGIVVRQVGRWWPVAVLAQLLVLLGCLTLLFARGSAVAGLLPGPGAFARLAELVGAGLDVTREQGPPVEGTQGVVLLLVASTGLVAIVVDLLAVSLRQPALAGLPLLAIYCVPAALLPGGLPWAYFALAAAGFLMLLAADSGDRIRSWGRVLTASTTGARTPRRPSTDGLQGLARGGRRVGAVTVLVAVLLPALVPGLGDRLLGEGGDGPGAGNGDGNTIRAVNPILNLRQDLVSGDDSPLIEYETQLTDPEPLRIVTADVYNGSTWAPRRGEVPRDQRVQEGLPAPPGLDEDVSAQEVETRIRVLGLEQAYLPLPYPARQVQVNGSWLYDATTLNVVGEGITTRRLAYTVRHLNVQPTAAELDGAGEAGTTLREYRRLPDELPQSIRDRAEQVAGEGSDYAQAVRMQRWFRQAGGFEYSVEAPQSENGDGSTDAIATFLQDKRGYCVHFASAMAVMARTLGIPARVGIGFLPGETQADGSRVIRAKDAHAWPELYFEGVGWVRFEPTPRAGEATPPEWAVPPLGVLPEDALPSASAAPTSEAAPSATPAPDGADQESAASDGAADPGLLERVPWRVVGVVALVLLLAASPLLAATLGSRRRWRRALGGPARAEAAWDELRRRLGDLGVRWVGSWTPRAAQRRLSGDVDLDGAEGAALARLVSEVETARYAPPTDDPGRPVDERRADVRLLVRAVAETVRPRTRHLARWLPASGLTSMSELARRADEAGATASRRVSDSATGLRESVGAGTSRPPD